MNRRDKQMVRTERLELSHLAALEPKSSVSTNSTTSAATLGTKTPDLSLAFPKYGVDEGDRTLDTRSHNPVLYQLSYAHHINHLYQNRQMARPAGLEPATTRLEGGCSIQLSYGRLSICINDADPSLGCSRTNRFAVPSHPADAVLDKRANLTEALQPKSTTNIKKSDR